MRLDETPFGPMVAVGKSLLLFTVEGDSPVLNALDLSVATSRWSRRTPHGWSSSRPYLWRGSVLVGSEAGELAALAIDDGMPIWTRRLNGVARGIGHDADLLFVGTLKGTVSAVRPPEAQRR